MVKQAKSTICDICELKSARYEIFRVLAITVLIRCKMSNELRTRFVKLVH